MTSAARTGKSYVKVVNQTVDGGVCACNIRACRHYNADRAVICGLAARIARRAGKSTCTAQYDIGKRCAVSAVNQTDNTAQILIRAGRRKRAVQIERDVCKLRIVCRITDNAAHCHAVVARFGSAYRHAAFHINLHVFYLTAVYRTGNKSESGVSPRRSYGAGIYIYYPYVLNRAAREVADKTAHSDSAVTALGSSDNENRLTVTVDCDVRHLFAGKAVDDYIVGKIVCTRRGSVCGRSEDILPLFARGNRPTA